MTRMAEADQPNISRIIYRHHRHSFLWYTCMYVVDCPIPQKACVGAMSLSYRGYY
jgi:hypothetical protein